MKRTTSPDIFIERDGTPLRVGPGDLDPATSHATGQPVSLRVPNALAALSPGFVTILGNQLFRETGEVVRLYWNFHHWGVPAFIESVTRTLNGDEIPFTLKVVSDPDGYRRCDAVVLRVHQADLERATPALQTAYTIVRNDLKQPVPALTLRVAPGVGFVEEPPHGMSFGLHRCALIAAGLLTAWEQNQPTIDTIINTFTSEGIVTERPYLNPRSTDEPKLSLTTDVVFQTSARHSEIGANRYLDVAGRIADELCNEAIWQDDRCTWVGVQPRYPNTPDHHGMTWTSLGPNLYDGASGVALLIAELASTTGDDRYHQTALGAVRRALSRCEPKETHLRLGLFTGVTGIAIAAGRVATLLDDPIVLGQVQEFVSCASELPGDAMEHDLVGGMAGGIIALLAIQAQHGRDEPLTAARALGDWLVAHAQHTGEGVAWRSLSRPGMYPLIGLSHGAAGIAVALLELWHATGQDRYRDVAEQALEFEQAWFDPSERNWPDFRDAPVRDGTPVAPFHFETHWCHGAPGIALARLRAWQLTGDDRYRDQAIVALQTTEAAVLQSLDDGTDNYSLCHGLAGNAEILLRGYHALGEQFTHLRTT
ncbi:MAG TPA: lanthionine synthetase LanC family protein, partial [Thermomicrobiales bacterium]|nr:lanthionine synthetase LanC family protein [Thermomicrobiales bacterium]